MNILPFRVALAQINVTVGDLVGNTLKIRAAMQEAYALGAHVVCLPELALTGYPPEDLLLKPGFVEDNIRKLDELIAFSLDLPGLVAVIGFVDRDHDIYNAAAVIAQGKLAGVYHKHYLPNYGVFDENRYFLAGHLAPLFEINGVHVGVNICEDVWYPTGPMTLQAFAGAEVILNINGSPYYAGKGVFRQGRLRVKPDEVPVIPVSTTRSPIQQEQQERAVLGRPQRVEGKMGHLQEIYSALVVGTGDYVRKTGFKKAIIGLSGGIDSSLTAVIAVDALGAENVLGISMPSGYSSAGSKTDAQELAENLGIQYMTIPIEETFRASLHMLEPALGEGDPGLAAENLQARIRGNILMAISNKLGPIVLTTGNKSEMAVGYSTLYGDMAGGFAVLKDVFKTLVYELCAYRNSLGDKPVIPQSVIDKPPSAELRPGQKDVDSLPPYEVLDPILQAYAEEDRTFAEILAMGFDRATIERVMRLVDVSEYKRRQAPPGIKITPRAFGRDRRLPITNRYRESG